MKNQIIKNCRNVKRVRITLTLDEDVALKIDQAAKKYGIPKSSYIILSTIEKIKKEENKLS